MGLTVAVTGPTGEIGKSAVDALERREDVDRVLGMARRPFDPGLRGWSKTEYRQGDVLDRQAVEALVADADVVVHLAYVIMGSHAESREVNLTGTRNVFEATVTGAARRLVYTSSVAAYGFHPANPLPLTEDVPPRGSPEHYYSAQKAECEAILRETTADSELEVVVLRPCIVAGPDAPLLLNSIPYNQLAERLPGLARRLIGVAPGIEPVLPDFGVPFQLVHHDDVASAIALATTGSGVEGAYNLAGAGEITMSDLATALGWHSLRVPKPLVDVVAKLVDAAPFAPAEAEWVQAFRTSVVMDTARAHRELGWRPQHDSAGTLREMVTAYRG